MPFQAIPIAFRAGPGDPLAKLAWIYFVHHAVIEDAPNGKGFILGETSVGAKFCQCSNEEFLGAIRHLERCGFLRIVKLAAWGDTPDCEYFLDLELPMSDLRLTERKRFKATPDQIALLSAQQNYRCVTCGEEDSADDFHADHIIPRSKGGADTEANMQALCGPCNLRKGAKIHFVDFIGGRR